MWECKQCVVCVQYVCVCKHACILCNGDGIILQHTNNCSKYPKTTKVHPLKVVVMPPPRSLTISDIRVLTGVNIGGDRVGEEG